MDMACIPFAAEDNSLDDAELWDFIDTTIAGRSTHKAHSKPLLLTHHTPTVTELPPSPQSLPDPRFSKGQKRQLLCKSDSMSSSKMEPQVNRSSLVPAYMVEAALDDSPYSSKQRTRIQPPKMPRREEDFAVTDYRSSRSKESSITAQRSHMSSRFPFNQIVAHDPNLPSSHNFNEHLRGNIENRPMAGIHSPVNDWMPNTPSPAMFKHYQNAALSVLEKGDYVVVQGKTFIKKCGWRKIAFFCNISFEIKDRTIEFDQNNNVQRAEFIVRANMQSGRYADGWGSCDRGEKRYTKPNHDIPSTAETRAKTRACQDLLGIGEYKGAGVGW